jgi:hypothetical protein
MTMLDIPVYVLPINVARWVFCIIHGFTNASIITFIAMFAISINQNKIDSNEQKKKIIV